MKKIMSIILVGMFLSFLQIDNVFSKKEDRELKQISGIAASNKVEVEEWKIYYRIIKKEQSKNSINNYIKQIEKDQPFTWVKDKEQHHYNIKGFSREGAIEKRVTIDVLPDNNTSTLVMTLEIKGVGNPNSANSQILKAPKVLEKGSRYVTVQGLTKGAVAIDQLSNNLKKAFSVKYIEGVKEKNFISISGYTSQWSEKLKAKGEEPINIQIGLRKNAKGQIKTTIGTPIITSEY
ncbi:hypothetical protein ELQ35_02310 [Peribacillus cavernae]|uniref:TATA-box binding n=1 Tax=Peribacillus cavernae TaxID=1674310 RepID=A0A3S1BB72_9BACI|nr:YwmB family TATA-box binding protein [Peribacillus cavernae]MDQ0219981.1 Txe/YoeB family toxin of Txe-Axe toxin-antitoxin module [Peribacillus cavernae]RUQ32046.1 hypothetical protein ELQ35_02310 [Peribacillus cavernae]